MSVRIRRAHAETAPKIVLRKFYYSFRRRQLTRIINQEKKAGAVALLDLERENWGLSLQDPHAFYLKCFRYFHFQLPEALRKHREYFQQDRRGFGEDAFHVMWFILFREFAFRNFLEIGVYRGQTLSLISLLQQQHGHGEVTGISPFSAVGDTVSEYLQEVDYLEDTRTNFSAFSLPAPELLRAYSTDSEAVTLILSRQWDCIYVDGNHDYEIASRDVANAAAALQVGGILVLDDSGLTTKFEPPPFATRGHPGPSRIAAEMDRNRFQEILQVGHNRVFQKLL